MLKRLIDFTKGTRILYASKENFTVLANLMMKNEIKYEKQKKHNEGFSFVLSEWSYLILKSVAESENLPLTLKRKGIPQLIFRYRKRVGALVGAILFLVLCKLSTMYVWDVRVEGNERISDSEIIENLKTLGFGVGSNIKKTDYYEICHELLLLNDELSWVSVNMEGTGATVKVMERDKKGDKADNGTPSNIVARFDGEIVRTVTESGTLEVGAGQTVKAGELLINGVVKVGQGDSGRFVLVRSKGSIYAKTNRVFRVEVPLSSVQSVIKKQNVAKKTVNFFGKTLKLKENSSISPDKCDIIEVNKRLVLFEGFGHGFEIALPITFKTVYVPKYEEIFVTYTEDEALKIAMAEMSEQVNEELKDAELLSKTEGHYIDSGVLVLVWDITCIEDIACESPIGII